MNSSIIAGIGLLAIGLAILKTGVMGGIGGPYYREDHPLIINSTIVIAGVGGIVLIVLGLIQ